MGLLKQLSWSSFQSLLSIAYCFQIIKQGRQGSGHHWVHPSKSTQPRPRKTAKIIGRTITSAVLIAHYNINQFRLRIMNRTCLRRAPSKHSQNGKGTEQVFRCAAGQEDKTLELIKLCRKHTVETEDELEETQQNFGAGKHHNDYIELLSNSDLKNFVDYEEETEACLF